MRRHPPRPLFLALVAGLALASPAVAQVRLTSPKTTLPGSFGPITTVRELSDGRVLTVDPTAGVLLVLDPRGGATRVGSTGGGDGQYQDPDDVFPLPGDSTLLVDLGNGRLTVVAPDLTFARSLPIYQGGSIMSGTPLILALPSATDGAGRIYSATGGGSPGPGQPPMAGVVRFSPTGGTPDTVARIRIAHRKVEASGGMRRVVPIPLSPQDAWGVAPDGSVVIARVDDYHVEWIRPDRTVRRGSPVPFTPVPVGPGERQAYVSYLEWTGGGARMMARMVNGTLSLTFAMNHEPTAPDEADFPKVMPPFWPDRILVDPQGRAWVHRSTPAGSPTTYDVFDRNGARVGSVALDGDRRVVGFGSRGIYVSARAKAGVYHLEVYGEPSSFRRTPPGERLTSWLRAQDGSGGVNADTLFTPGARRPSSMVAIAPGAWSLGTDGPLTDVEILGADSTHVSAVAVSQRTRRWFRLTLQVQPTAPWRVTDLSVTAGDPPPAVLARPVSDRELAADMDAYLHALDSVNAFAGTALVARGDTVLYLGAVGVADRTTGEPDGPDTRYALGSLNKMWTAVAILHLVEEGRVDLDAPVGRYLPDYPSVRAREEVRIGQLLTHTSGLGDFAGMEFFRSRGTLRTMNDWLALVSKQDPRFPPGTRASYSNAGYLVLGAVVEAVTGQSYYDYLKTAVFGPAGMTASAFDLASDRRPGTAVGYTRLGRGAPGAGGDGRSDNLGSIPLRGSSAGGGYSNVTDLYRFSRALMEGRLMGPKMTSLLLAPTQRSPSGRLMAYGARVFRSDGIFWSGHGGGAPGMNAELQIDPKTGYVIAVLSNYDPDAAGIVADKARELVARREAGTRSPG